MACDRMDADKAWMVLEIGVPSNYTVSYQQQGVYVNISSWISEMSWKEPRTYNGYGV